MACAVSTLAASAGRSLVKEGKPRGHWLLRSGLGSGAPCALNHLGMRFSLARDAVPHGGPMCTYFTRPCAMVRMTSSWPSLEERSTDITGMIASCLLCFQSTPMASKPWSQSEAVYPAWPAHSSRANGRAWGVSERMALVGLEQSSGGGFSDFSSLGTGYTLFQGLTGVPASGTWCHWS